MFSFLFFCVRPFSLRCFYQHRTCPGLTWGGDRWIPKRKYFWNATSKNVIGALFCIQHQKMEPDCNYCEGPDGEWECDQCYDRACYDCRHICMGCQRHFCFPCSNHLYSVGFLLSDRGYTCNHSWGDMLCDQCVASAVGRRLTEAMRRQRGEHIKTDSEKQQRYARREKERRAEFLFEDDADDDRCDTCWKETTDMCGVCRDYLCGSCGQRCSACRQKNCVTCVARVSQKHKLCKDCAEDVIKHNDDFRKLDRKIREGCIKKD